MVSGAIMFEEALRSGLAVANKIGLHVNQAKLLHVHGEEEGSEAEEK